MKLRFLIAAFALTGCVEEDVPATPTYEADIRPILRANCLRCHEPFASGDAGVDESAVPMRFRFDRWDDTCESDAGVSGPDGGADAPSCVLGVYQMAERIVVRAADEGTMPPTGPLTERQREILKRWARAGWPEE